MLKQMILAKENEIYRVILTASVCQRAKIRRFLHQLTTQSINTLLGVQRIKAEIKLPTYEQPTSTCYLDSASSLDLLASFMTFAAFCAILTVPHLTRGLSAGLGEGRDRRFPPDIRINNSRKCSSSERKTIATVSELHKQCRYELKKTLHIRRSISWISIPNQIYRLFIHL